MAERSFGRRFYAWLVRLVGRMVTVRAVPVGQPGDGLVGERGGLYDRSWGELSEQYRDVLELWRRNPLARRLVGLTTSYVVGDGITLSSDYGPLQRYLAAWWSHPQNMMDLRLGAWCDELARMGELFIALHFNRADGMSYVRLIPASSIDRITWAPGDYERELSYHEVVGIDDPDYERGGREWLAVGNPEADKPIGEGDAAYYRPVVLHVAVNRPVGCVRGDSDLASVIPWLRYYSQWLEDRVDLNAAVRSFLWIAHVSRANIETRKRELMQPPEPGSVIVVEQGAEEWEVVAPTLHAADAERDGRAIRWMIAAGGPGIGLTDLGEAETANLATARAMADQRTRFLKQRQAYFGYMLARLGLESYNRAVRLGRWRGRERTLDDIRVEFSDVSVSDNAELGQAASHIAEALRTLQDLGVQGPAFRRLALRLVLRFAGEQMGDEVLDELLAGAQDDGAGG